jgi:hypothetical protein
MVQKTVKRGCALVTDNEVVLILGSLVVLCTGNCGSGRACDSWQWRQAVVVI